MYLKLTACQGRAECYWKVSALNFISGSLGILLLIILPLACSSVETPTTAEGPSPELTPAEQLQTFQIEQGLTVELVAAEPLVEDPVVCTFDEDGRLWVVEMRAYMPNVDGEQEREPNGRISVLEDRDADGVMDASTIYLDSLVLPRALGFAAGGVLVVESEALWMTQDLDGDLRADTKTLIDPDYAGNAQPEHAGNGLWRGIDNWYYNAKSRFRYRLIDGEWKKDSTEFRGQWGISHDDAGRLYYNYNWSQLHADLVPPNYLTRNKNHTPVTGIDKGLTLDRRIYPIRPTPAVNRGYIPGILDDEKKLKEFTAACSPLVYRGTALPSAYYGNVFVCEPSGNLIKRNVVENVGLDIAAHDPHPGREFLASTDERFRPVHLATGPDGTLYVADMYRGLIQHKAYITPYLREQTLSRELVFPIHRGRIWRIVPENWKPPQRIKLSALPASQLVSYLSNSNGWYRDMAQRLLVERNDEAAIAPLTRLALTGEDPLGKFHALWALEGLGHRDPGMLFTLLDDPDAMVRSTALRLLEPLAASDRNIRMRLGHMLPERLSVAPQEQVLQMAFTASELAPEASLDLLQDIANHYDTSALIRDAILSSLADRELTFLKRLHVSPEWKTETPSKEIFLESLTNAVVRKRDPSELRSLLAMISVDRSAFGWREKALLTGMSIQGYTGRIAPVKLASQPGILSRKDLGIPASQLEGLNALFEWPGSPSRIISNKAKALDEDEKQLFALGRKLYLNSCSGCHGNEGEGLQRFAPPLRGSEWVLGDARRLTLILLHGIQGPLEVAGKRYAEPEILPVMPGHSTLGDQQLSAIVTYIRNEWGNQAGPIERNTVGRTRLTHQGRVMPWTAEELDARMGEFEKSEKFEK